MEITSIVSSIRSNEDLGKGDGGLVGSTTEILSAVSVQREEEPTPIRLRGVFNCDLFQPHFVGREAARCPVCAVFVEGRV